MANFNNNLFYVTLVRHKSNSYGTFGELTIDGLIFSTLEPIRPIIPVGCYLITFTYSPRFGNKIPYNEFNGQVPLVNGVKGHEGIRIHVGNSVNDTHGCILIGTSFDGTILLGSRKAYRDLMQRVQQRKYYNPDTFYVLEVTESYEE